MSNVRKPRKQFLGDQARALRYYPSAVNQLKQWNYTRPSADYLAKTYSPAGGVTVDLVRRPAYDRVRIKALKDAYLTLGADAPSDKATLWHSRMPEDGWRQRRIASFPDTIQFHNAGFAGRFAYNRLIGPELALHEHRLELTLTGVDSEETFDFGYDHRNHFSGLWSGEIFAFWAWRYGAFLGNGRWGAMVMYGDQYSPGEAIGELDGTNYLDSALAIYDSTNDSLVYRTLPPVIAPNPNPPLSSFTRLCSQPIYMGNETICVFVCEHDDYIGEDPDGPVRWFYCLRSTNMGQTWTTHRLLDMEDNYNRLEAGVSQVPTYLSAAFTFRSLGENQLMVVAPHASFTTGVVPVSYDSYHAYYSNNGGVTWSNAVRILQNNETATFMGPVTHSPAMVCPVAPGACIIPFARQNAGPTYSYHIARTTNNGASWSIHDYPEQNDVENGVWDAGLRVPALRAVHSADADTAPLVLVAWDGTEDLVYLSDDGGLTWPTSVPFSPDAPALANREIMQFPYVIPEQPEADLVWPERFS